MRSNQNPFQKASFKRNSHVWHAANLQLKIADILREASRFAFDPRDRQRLQNLADQSELAAESLGAVSRRQRGIA